MSVPSCVKMPVRGARNPILSSCACACIDAPKTHAAATYISGNVRPCLFIVVTTSLAIAGLQEQLVPLAPEYKFAGGVITGVTRHPRGRHRIASPYVLEGGGMSALGQ